MLANRLVLFFPALSEKRPALYAEGKIRLSDLASLANKQIQVSYHGSNPLWSLNSFRWHNAPIENALKFFRYFTNTVI